METCLLKSSKRSQMFKVDREITEPISVRKLGLITYVLYALRERYRGIVELLAATRSIHHHYQSIVNSY